MNCLLTLTKASACALILSGLFGCELSEGPGDQADSLHAVSDTLIGANDSNKRPNIILVITDDQGYGDVGYNSNPIVKTPTIDALAEQSVRFTNFHVDPTCAPTRAALMSGQYSLRSGVWHTVMGRHMLSNDHTILPEHLKGAGYATAMFGKWHLGDNYPFRPQDQGFDHVVMHGAGGVGQTPDAWGNTQFDDIYLNNGEEKQYKGYATDVWFDEAISFMQDKSKADAPYFVYLSTNAPHVPYRVAEAYSKPYRDLGLPNRMALFYGMITNLDDNMQRLFTALKATGQEENTIVMFMTDNGSSLPHLVPDEYETLIDILPKEVKTQFGDTLTTLNANMRGAKASTYEGGHRVPFFIKWPGGHFTGAKEVTGLSAHFDVLPTLLDLAGIDAELDTDGMSFAPSLQKGEALPDRTLVVTNQRVLNPFAERPYSVMNGNWRYVHAEERGGIALFDLSKDPSQATDIAQQHPERVAEMAAAYSDWWKHTTSAGTPTTRPIVGTDHEPLMRLTGHDWLSPNTSQVAWWPGFEYEGDRWSRGWLNNEARYRVSPWALRVGAAGNYHFEILLHDKAAEKVIDKAFAHLELNGKLHTVELAKGSTSAVFTADLPLGELDVRAWFDDASDSSSIESGLPAFFLYVEQASETNE